MKKWLSIGIENISKSYWVNIENRSFIKPNGGLWASPYTPNDKYQSAWHEFCSEVFPNGVKDYGVVFDLKNDTRIYTIDGAEDLCLLYEKYKLNIGECDFMKCLDFEKISLDYDCIHLTDKGQCETRFSFPINLYGWDVESLLVLNFDCIGDSEYIEFK